MPLADRLEISLLLCADNVSLLVALGFSHDRTDVWAEKRFHDKFITVVLQELREPFRDYSYILF